MRADVLDDGRTLAMDMYYFTGDYSIHTYFIGTYFLF